MTDEQEFRVTIRLRRRPDGGLRAWSDELPGLVLSHRDPAKVLADLAPAVEFIASERLGGAVKATLVEGDPRTAALASMKRPESILRRLARTFARDERTVQYRTAPA